MMMKTRTLSDLRTGDRIHKIGSIDHSRKPLEVERELAQIHQGVFGLSVGTLPGGVEFILYPAQCNGQDIIYER